MRDKGLELKIPEFSKQKTESRSTGNPAIRQIGKLLQSAFS
jgi:hypothetical protein